MSKSDETEQMGEALEAIATEFSKHSGPHPQASSSERQRAKLGRDLRAAALRYARAYYAEARELGLIPEYERADNPKDKPGYLNKHGAYICGPCSSGNHLGVNHGGTQHALCQCSCDGVHNSRGAIP